MDWMQGSEDDFRDRIRLWLDENCPQEMRDAGYGRSRYLLGRSELVVSIASTKAMAAKCRSRWHNNSDMAQSLWRRWLRSREKILAEEMGRIQARPPLQSFGIWMLGPALLKFGTEEQKMYLPDIIKGNIRWCQYSEPGAGSDLAGLQTKAEDHEDHYVVTGQKIWTSYADKAD